MGDRTGRRLWRWIVAGLVVAGMGGFVWYQTRPKPVEVTVKPVTRGTVEQTVANTRAGTVKACRRARLSPSIGGQIARLPIHEGDTVKAGQLLLEIWNEDLKAQLNLAEKQAASAAADARAAFLNAQVAKRDADRLKKLLATGAASEESTDQAVTRAKALQAQYESALSSVKMSRARIAVARANLARTRLIAPFDGVVAKITGELNEYVTPSPVGVPTPPTVDLIENDCFYVSAPIDEVDAAQVRVGMPARITLDAYKSRRFEGRVRRIAPYVQEIEKQARTVDIEVSFVNLQDFRRLLAGYSADVEIILAVKRNTLRIPTEAVLDRRRVFVFDPVEKVVRERSVSVGISNWSFTEVLSGVKAGDQVVVNVDNPALKDGAAAVVSEAAL